MSSPPYKHGSTQLEFRPEDLEEIHHVQTFIRDEDLAKEGRENDIHLTIRYGADSGEFSHLYHEVRNDFKQLPITVIGFGIFDTEDGACLHMLVEKTDELTFLYQLIEETMECIKPTFPNWIPHITLSFLKSRELAESVKRRIESSFELPLHIVGEQLVWCKQDGSRNVIPLSTSQELATEAIKTAIYKRYKKPKTARITVAKNTLSDYAVKKNAKRVEEIGGSYDKHENGSHLFRVPAEYAKQIYHSLYHERGVGEKNDPSIAYY